MRDIQDLQSGIHYLEMTSRPRETKKHHSTLGEGLVIFGGFLLSMAAIVIAI